MKTLTSSADFRLNQPIRRIIRWRIIQFSVQLNLEYNTDIVFGSSSRDWIQVFFSMNFFRNSSTVSFEFFYPQTLSSIHLSSGFFFQECLRMIHHGFIRKFLKRSLWNFLQRFPKKKFSWDSSMNSYRESCVDSFQNCIMIS